MCNSCGNVENKQSLSTIISYDPFGNMIVSYICKVCVRDKTKFDNLLNCIDKNLIEMKKTPPKTT